jgi:mRNA interferase MazF
MAGCEMIYAPFDVVVVPFPYTDRQADKRRPALVVSAEALQEKFGLVWLMMITSADNTSWECDVGVSDQKLAGLPAPSLVRTAKIATVDATRILRRLGKLSVKDAKAVKPAMAALLAA